MKYQHDPDRPEEPILEASPREIDARRDWLRRCLRSSWTFDHADVEDAVQNVVIVACRLIAEKRVRGKYAMTPEKRLQSLLRVILRNFAANTKRLQRYRSRFMVNDIPLAEGVPDGHSTADVRLEAREAVEEVCNDDTQCVQMLLRLAIGDHPAEIARDVGRRVNTVYASVQRGRNIVVKKHRNAKR